MGVLDASTSPPKERYAVSKDNVIKLIQPAVFDDQLTEVLRNGARALLARAVEAKDFLDKHAEPRQGRIVASPATDCGPSCPQSCGGEEG